MSEQKAQEQTAILPGDYVLATKYGDGDPNDQWAIGFYDGQKGDRHYVRDSEGQQFRANGFRRVAKISAECGEWILGHKQDIEIGSRSLWWWAQAEMNPAEGGPESMNEQKAPMSREEAVREVQNLCTLLALGALYPTEVRIRAERCEEVANALQLLLDSEERQRKAIAALDLILFPNDDRDDAERQHMRNQLVDDLAAAIERHGWAGDAEENREFITEAANHTKALAAALGDAIRFIMSHPVDVVGTPDEAKRDEIIERLQATLNEVAPQEGGKPGE